MKILLKKKIGGSVNSTYIHWQTQTLSEYRGRDILATVAVSRTDCKHQTQTLSEYRGRDILATVAVSRTDCKHQTQTLSENAVFKCSRSHFISELRMRSYIWGLKRLYSTVMLWYPIWFCRRVWPGVQNFWPS